MGIFSPLFAWEVNNGYSFPLEEGDLPAPRKKPAKKRATPASRKRAARSRRSTEVRTKKACTSQRMIPGLPARFDVAITVAGPQREIAEAVAVALRKRGLTVFYDRFYTEALWGVNLADCFDQIFRMRSRYCLMFVSRDYARREWTNHERQMAIARAISERGNAYILPVQLDDTVLPGLPPTIGYLPLADYETKEIVALVVKKVRAGRRRR